MLKLGLVGAVDSFHGRAFASLLSGKDEAAWKELGFWDPGPDRVQGARLVALWDLDPALSARLARLCSIPEVAASPTDILGRVDGVIIPDDMTLAHQRRAHPFLEAGLPVFIDKPLAPDPQEAAQLIALARQHGALLMSCSALRYARELEEARQQIADLEPIIAASAVGPGELATYGIHPAELFHSALGAGIQSAQDLGQEGRHIIHIRYHDGRTVVLSVLKDVRYVFHLCLYGERGWHQFTVSDSAHFYRQTLQQFVGMIEHGQEPIPLDHTLELIRLLAAARRSLEQGGRRVRLDELATL